MSELDSRLSRVSDDFGTILDKAISEPGFRWNLIYNSEEVLKKYAINNEDDIIVFQNIIQKLNAFIIDRLSAFPELESIKLLYNNNEKFKKTNPNIDYEYALNYKINQK